MITDIYNAEGFERGFYDHSMGFGVFQDWWEPELLEAVRDEFTALGDPAWYWIDTHNERMFRGSEPSVWSTPLRELLSQMRGEEFISLLQDLTGIEGLRADTASSGYRLFTPGGFQRPHVIGQPDELGWHRFHVEILLNKDWKDFDGGELTLHGGRGLAQQIPPSFNRTVAVKTDESVFRGVAPTNRRRRSVVMDYYSDKPAEGSIVPHRTIWLDS